MYYAVLTHANNPEPTGPANWPWKVEDLGESQTLPDEPGWQLMTYAEYDQYIVDNLDAYNQYVSDNHLIDSVTPYKFTGKNDDPTSKPYEPNIKGLFKKLTYVQGDLTSVQYYNNYDENTQTYSDLVLEEEYTYYTSNYLVYKRDILIKWYRQDDTVGITKTITKIYNPLESYNLLMDRYDNILSEASMTLVYLIGTIPAQIFLNESQCIIAQSVYKKGYHQPLLDYVSNSSLDSGVKAAILGILTI